MGVPRNGPVGPRPRRLRPGLLLCAALAAASAAGWGAAWSGDATSSAEPSTDAASSPTSSGGLPDLAARPTEQVRIEGDPSDGGRWLRFSTTIANVGSAPLELLGEPDPAAGTIVVRQRVAGAGGEELRVVGTFVFDGAHGHWHFADLVVTELWTLWPDGALARLRAATEKTSFCLVDAWRLEPPPAGAAAAPLFLVCVPERQGLSPGWADRYDATLPGQAMEIGDLADGRYALRTIVDPDGLRGDADPANNTLTVAIELAGDAVEIGQNPI